MRYTFFWSYHFYFLSDKTGYSIQSISKALSGISSLKYTQDQKKALVLISIKLKGKELNTTLNNDFICKQNASTLQWHYVEHKVNSEMKNSLSFPKLSYLRFVPCICLVSKIQGDFL
jgi:hypothetical protein